MTSNRQSNQTATTQNVGSGRGKTGVVGGIKNFFAGNVSRTLLLKIFLPLSTAAHFGALAVAAMFFPTHFDWRVRVISALTDPEDNPRSYLLASVSVMVAMLLLVPFAGYLRQRLEGIEPRLARASSVAFTLAFGLTFISMVVQLAQSVIGPKWLHAFLAGVAAGCFVVGMFCATACALQERRRHSGENRSLSNALVNSWISLTWVPVVCLAGVGLLVLLGRKAGLVWVEDFRQSFRHTPLWRLAFWEWIGMAMAYGFLVLSALLLPASAVATPGQSEPATKPAATEGRFPPRN